MDMEVEHRLTEVESRAKSNTHRIDEVEKRQNNLTDLIISIRELAVRENKVEDDVKSVKDDIKAVKNSVQKITERSANHWDELGAKILWAVIAGVIGFALAAIGL